MSSSEKKSPGSPGTPEMPALPVVDNCDDCGACCRKTPVPPFQPGEESVWEVTPEQRQPILDRIAADQHFDNVPCVWFDEAEAQCRHYDQRPQACRDFEIGGVLCRLSRSDVGLPA